MIQSSTSPCLTTMFGTLELRIEGRRRLAIHGDVEGRGAVGILRDLSSFSEKYSLRTRTGATLPSQGSAAGGSGSGLAVSRARGSGASGAATMEASARFGSFSPP